MDIDEALGGSTLCRDTTKLLLASACLPHKYRRVRLVWKRHDATADTNHLGALELNFKGTHASIISTSCVYPCVHKPVMVDLRETFRMCISWVFDGKFWGPGEQGPGMITMVSISVIFIVGITG